MPSEAARHAQAVRDALEHLQAAQSELANVMEQCAEDARACTPVASASTTARARADAATQAAADLPADLPAAYRTLLDEYAALRAEFDAHRESWLEFKRWWKSRVQEKRARRQGVAYAAPPSPESASFLRRTITSPRRTREQIVEHRRQVRAQLRENPGLFKGLGRYASPAASSAGRSATPQMHTHAADCVCCREVRPRHMLLTQYYAAVGHAASPKRRCAVSSRHRSAQPPDPTPPGYWCVRHFCLLTQGRRVPRDARGRCCA